jgi:hypothetical protein
MVVSGSLRSGSSFRLGAAFLLAPASACLGFALLSPTFAEVRAWKFLSVLAIAAGAYVMFALPVSLVLGWPTLRIIGRTPQVLECVTVGAILGFACAILVLLLYGRGWPPRLEIVLIGGLGGVAGLVFWTIAYSGRTSTP